MIRVFILDPDPGSGYLFLPILDPGFRFNKAPAPGLKKAPDPAFKKAPDPGSGSATLPIR